MHLVRGITTKMKIFITFRDTSPLTRSILQNQFIS
jgi:hypothetical protein